MRSVSCFKNGWFHVSYFFDYLIILLIFGGLGVVTFLVHPYCRFQDVSSPLVKFPVEKDIFPSWTLVFPVFVIPLVVFLAAQAFSRKWSSHEFHSCIFTLIEGICLVFLFTQLGKYYAGRPRPNWEAQVIEQKLDIGEGYKALCEISTLFDARLSFPSGHSSFSFMGMTLVSLYFAGKTALFSRGHGNMLKMTMFVIPLLFAGVIAISRTRDYHHNYVDILAGSLIGIFTAMMAYFMNFPPLTSSDCHLPYNRFEIIKEHKVLRTDISRTHSDHSGDNLI